MRVKRPVFPLCAFWLFAFAMFGADPTGTIAGTVLDPSGAAVVAADRIAQCLAEAGPLGRDVAVQAKDIVSPINTVWVLVTATSLSPSDASADLALSLTSRELPTGLGPGSRRGQRR